MKSVGRFFARSVLLGTDASKNFLSSLMTVERLLSKISVRRLLSSWVNRSESGRCSAGGLGCGLDEGGSDNCMNVHKAQRTLWNNMCC